MKKFEYRCSECKKLIPIDRSRGDDYHGGFLWVSFIDIRKHEDGRLDKKPEPWSGEWVVTTFEDLPDEPEFEFFASSEPLAKWRITCWDCTPEANVYHWRLDRVRDNVGCFDFIAHVLDKEWVTSSTDILDLIDHFAKRSRDESNMRRYSTKRVQQQQAKELS